MAKTEKEQAHSAEEKQEAISIETAKVIQGISLVFSGAVTMLEPCWKLCIPTSPWNPAQSCIL